MHMQDDVLAQVHIYVQGNNKNIGVQGRAATGCGRVIKLISTERAQSGPKYIWVLIGGKCKGPSPSVQLLTGPRQPDFPLRITLW